MADLVPNDGSFFIAPLDEKAIQKANKERAEVLAIMPFLQKTIDWFDVQAKEFDKVTNIDLEHPNLSGDQQIMAYQLAAKLLMTKKGELQSYLNTYDIKQR